jgi:hypothetical protein
MFVNIYKTAQYHHTEHYKSCSSETAILLQQYMLIKATVVTLLRNISYCKAFKIIAFHILQPQMKITGFSLGRIKSLWHPSLICTVMCLCAKLLEHSVHITGLNKLDGCCYASSKILLHNHIQAYQ